VHVGLRVFHPDEHGVPLPKFVRALGGEPQSRCRCGRGEPSPGSDVAGVSPVPVQMWQR
jgi:hypothetical protein